MQAQHYFYNGNPYIISSFVRPCGKIGYIAHYRTNQIDKQYFALFGKVDIKLCRINPSMRVKGKRLIAKPYNSTQDAIQAIIAYDTRYDVRSIQIH